MEQPLPTSPAMRHRDSRLQFAKLPATYLILGTVCLLTLSFAYIRSLSRLPDQGLNFFGGPLLLGMGGGALLAYLNYRLKSKERSERVFLVQVIESLSMALDERDQYTHGHARRVTNLSMLMAEKLGLSVKKREILRLSGILHDIGKVGVPDAVLHKPGKLTDAEFQLIKKHPEQGCNILLPMKADGTIREIMMAMRHHHERYDGNGYPDGLAGEKIPLPARIIAIADAFDAMTSDRPYRKGMALPEALAEIQKGRSSQFAPDLCDLFLKLCAEAHDGNSCPSLDSCEIFSCIQSEVVAKAYETQYCRCFYKGCARYKIRNKSNRPVDLLPDGSLLPEKDDGAELLPGSFPVHNSWRDMLAVFIKRGPSRQGMMESSVS